MSALLERLNEEQRDLSIKVKKLDEFIDNNPVFYKLDDIQRVLLVTQLNTMKMYLYTLQERIYHLNK